MNLFKITCILIGLFYSSALYGQNEIIRLRLVNEQHLPVEGVYVGVTEQHCFWYSDTVGMVKIPLAGLSSKDTLSISHLSYKPMRIDIQSITASLNCEKEIHLQSDIKVLDEIVVKPLDPAALVKDAIDMIPQLYAPIFNPSLSVHADIDIFDARDSSSIIYYKGVLCISQPDSKKLPLVGKLTETEKISPDAKNQLYPIRTSNFAAMIPLQEQGVIRNFKNYTFDKYQYVHYRGEEAVQVHFHWQKGNFRQTGYLIIREDIKAIIALQYSTAPMKNVMKSTFKGGMRYTDLDSHKVEVDYGLNADNLYEFESGTYFVQYTNRQKKSAKSIVLNSHLKKISSFNVKPDTEVSIENLFINE